MSATLKKADISSLGVVLMELRSLSGVANTFVGIKATRDLTDRCVCRPPEQLPDRHGDPQAARVTKESKEPDKRVCCCLFKKNNLWAKART